MRKCKRKYYEDETKNAYFSFSGINDLEFQLEKLKEYLTQFAEVKNIEAEIII